MRNTLRLFAVAALILLSCAPAYANPFDRWEISCGVDRGSIKKSGNTWVFKTSKNKCEGGVFNQRAEIATQSISPKQKGTYLFRTYFSMRTDSREPFGMFQVHDGRIGCAPPLKVNVTREGRLEIHSDMKTGPGESCVKLHVGNGQKNGVIKRDGTEQLLEVLLNFTGDAGFDFNIKVDGRSELKGRYSSPTDPKAYRSEKFYLKHGVYSLNVFPYTMTSRGMSVDRVKVVN